jgi:hypothetical protein
MSVIEHICSILSVRVTDGCDRSYHRGHAGPLCYFLHFSYVTRLYLPVLVVLGF